MKILLLYDNFLRDFRGLLLLQFLLEELGHCVWCRATWNSPLKFAQLMNVDVIVGGQVAEASTHHTAKFAKENHIRFVLNSTENVSIPKNFEMFVTYNTSELNDDLIDLQSIATTDVFEFIINHPRIKPENKPKYKFLGFPRLDITMNEHFRRIEAEEFKRKYKLAAKKKVYLFISSFLLDGAFDGVPQRDLEKWNYSEIKQRTADLLRETSSILLRLINEVLGEDDVLLIKKHPWDCSSYFKDSFTSQKCIVLDTTDYILPCIVNADLVLHTYSTAAVEAWILGKKTISILLNEYKATTTLNHMVHELTASSFTELECLLNNYPEENPSLKALDLFSPHLDGKATVRLALEINRLTPHPHKTVFNFPLKSKVLSQVREWLRNRGVLKIDIEKRAKPNTKMYEFCLWENSKADVIRTYKKTFKKYAREHAKASTK